MFCVSNKLGLGQLDKSRAEFQYELAVVTELTRNLVYENARNVLDQSEYNSQYSALADRYEKIKIALSDIESLRLEKAAKREKAAEYINSLKKQNGLINEFDDELWLASVESMEVKDDKNIIFTFKDDSKIEWKQ